MNLTEETEISLYIEAQLSEKTSLYRGIGLLGYWFVLYWSEIWANLETIASNWISILFGVLMITLTSLAVIIWQKRRGKDPLSSNKVTMEKKCLIIAKA